ncbi:hypothetical protein D3C81_1513970 [compost metagenome]
MLFQHLGHGLVGWHLEYLPRAAHLHREAAIVAGIHWRRGKVLAVQVGLLPAQPLGAVQHMLHEPAGPANIQVHILLRVAQHPGDIQCGFRLLVKVHEQAVSERRVANALDKGRTLAGAGTVVQLEIMAAVGQLLGHAQDRGNADATGKQQAALRALGQREQVARRADAQPCAGLHLLMQAA